MYKMIVTYNYQIGVNLHKSLVQLVLSDSMRSALSSLLRMTMMWLLSCCLDYSLMQMTMMWLLSCCLDYSVMQMTAFFVAMFVLSVTLSCQRVLLHLDLNLQGHFD